MHEDYEPQEELPRALLREVYDWVEAGMMAVVCVVLLFTFVVRLAGVEGDSMLPTLHHQDRLLITRLGMPARQGDIVVVTKPTSRGEPLIKRVIATEGQMVYIDFSSQTVMVDGKELEEPYIAEPTALRYDMEFPQKVPEGCVFILGDNRNNSWDSRDWEVGMVDQRYILGKVVYRILPYDQMGKPS